MKRPPDLRELVGDDVAAAELDALARADSLLRSVPAPPAQIPPSLTAAVDQAARPTVRIWTRRRTGLALAFAAALSALSFGFGTRLSGEGFEERATFQMQATERAGGAEGLIRLGHPDESGNWPLRLEVEGLKPLPKGGYYLLWLAKDGEYGVACGSFAVGEGETEAEWIVSYRLADYDEWVVTAYMPGEPREAERPWLLTAKVKV